MGENRLDWAAQAPEITQAEFAEGVIRHLDDASCTIRCRIALRQSGRRSSASVYGAVEN